MKPEQRMKQLATLSTETLKTHLRALEGTKIKPVGSLSTMSAIDVIEDKRRISDELSNRGELN